MGRATRWLRSLLGGGGGKRENRESKDLTSYGGGGGGGEDRREKKRWSFGKSSKDGSGGGDVVLGQNSATAAAWMRSFCDERDKEQSKHAIAVATATAAAADAAVAAAQAAVAVVRLTSQGRGSSAAAAIAAFGSCRERHMKAAVKIQTSFRRYLARKAFRALRALVKLQALVRGYLVRKQAAATLLSMQALIRAQAAVRAQRTRTPPPPPNDRKLPLEFRSRRSLERFDETRSETMSAFHSRRFSANLDISSNTFDRSPKIVEVDTGRPRSRSSRRSNPSVSDPSDDPPHSSSLSSPLPFQIPAKISIPDSGDWGCLAGGSEKGRLSVTAQSTPRWTNHSGDAAAEEDGVLRRFFCGAPSYMAKTRSFEAKSRSQSAPKQRPEAEAAGGGRKRVPLSEVVMEAMATQRPWCRAPEEAFSFKSAVTGKLDRPSEFYVRRKW